MTTINKTFNILDFVDKIPDNLLSQSGKAFYSGRKAFSGRSELYVLGINPGGAPGDYIEETIGNHTAKVVRINADNWSAYRDESWAGAAPGTYGMAPRVLHLFTQLGLDPGTIPCSNLVFVRSRQEADMGQEIVALAEQCWIFHEFVITQIQPRVILCFGKTAGNYVRNKVGAKILSGEYIEENTRRWRSQSGPGL